MYALHFEKDQGTAGAEPLGHRHDRKSVVVFQKQGEEEPRRPAASRHGEYSTHPINEEVPMDGNRVRIVHHKDSGLTHAFRFANWGKANFPLSADFTDFTDYMNKAWPAAIPAF